LDGGPDGLDAYRRLIPALPRHLHPDGTAILELGAGQAADVAGIARQAGLDAAARDDLAGIARALVLRRRLP
jgi:release factor glutamine methyltransferase